MGTSSKDKRDIYYFRAKKLGYRARSAFKLLDINNAFGIFQGVRNAIDLCASPGSWSQVLSKNISGKILAIDIQEISEIEGVTTIVEDITSQRCLERISDFFNGEKVDLIISDGAPDVTGFHEIDEYLQTDILKSSLNIAIKTGRIGSTFVGKCFRGEYTKYIVRHFSLFYDTVKLVKPCSSRGASKECFIYCTGMKANTVDPLVIDINGDACDVDLHICGDGPNPDLFNEYDYNDNTEKKEVSAKPINPPYEEAIHLRRSRN